MSRLNGCKLLFVLGLALISSFPVRAEDKPDAKKEAKKDPKDMTADETEAAGLCPVSKKEFKPIYHYEVNGKTYHFCSRKCQTEFAANPSKFGVAKK